MDMFLSCDWGTTTFRLRLIHIPELQIVAKVTTGQGIAAVFKNWEATGKTAQPERITFYLSIIQEHLAELEKQVNISLDSIPVLLSGMASSTIGLLNLPYHPLPFSTDGSDIKTHLFPATSDFNHPIILISGVQSIQDVMRGEETQLIGCVPEDADKEEAIYIFPGTHSKHIRVKEKQVTAFNTYMTGEFFDLIRTKSILSASVQTPENNEPDLGSFRQGVQASVNTNLLQAAFLTRTNQLFERLTATQNYYFLSGLLIGTELQDLVKLSPTPKIYLCAGAGLKIYYETALAALGLSEKTHIFPAAWVDEAVVRGQYKIYQKLNLKA